MGSKPVIGVLPLVDIERDSFWMLPGYFQGVEQAGGLPVMLPVTDDKDATDNSLHGDTALPWSSETL